MEVAQAAAGPQKVWRPPFDVEDYVAGVRSGNRAMLGRAITLIESRSPKHQKLAEQVLLHLLPYTGRALRVGITGVPGAGKSTFIEALGKQLTGAGHKVAVLAVDPSSGISGGSILGDKTRMNELAIDPNAFIRPSPSSGTLGGVTRTTRETMLVCEAAGFDVVLIETVGAGQSEVMVAGMVDFFLVVMLPNAGDELQGIKKGILEIADMLAVNKADGDNLRKAGQAVGQYRNALKIMKHTSPNWAPPVVMCSSLEETGLDELWGKILEYRKIMTDTGELVAKRRKQQLDWMWSMIDDRLGHALRTHPRVRERLPNIEREVRDGRMTPTLAVVKVLDAFGLGDHVHEIETKSQT